LQAHMCDPDSSKILSEINELAHHYVSQH
jgi:hypothetical protein